MTPESSRGGRKLGQFFTPRPVVDFALAALQVFGASIEGSRLIDPACGPGEWLAAGLAAGAGTVTGVDCDPAMPLAWREAGLTSEPNCLLMVADSLASGDSHHYVARKRKHSIQVYELIRLATDGELPVESGDLLD